MSSFLDERCKHKVAIKNCLRCLQELAGAVEALVLERQALMAKVKQQNTLLFRCVEEWPIRCVVEGCVIPARFEGQLCPDHAPKPPPPCLPSAKLLDDIVETAILHGDG